MGNVGADSEGVFQQPTCIVCPVARDNRREQPKRLTSRRKEHNAINFPCMGRWQPHLRRVLAAQGLSEKSFCAERKRKAIHIHATGVAINSGRLPQTEMMARDGLVLPIEDTGTAAAYDGGAFM